MEGVKGRLGQGSRERYSGLGEVSEWGSDGGVVGYEATVEGSEAEEGAGRGNVMGQGPVGDSCDLFGVDAESLGGDTVAKEGSRVLGKGALGNLDSQVL